MNVSISRAQAFSSSNTKVVTRPLSKVAQANGNSASTVVGSLLIRTRKGDEKASIELLEHFQNDIRINAAHIYCKTYRWLSKEELNSEGLFGLVKAITEYNPTTHSNPDAYVKACIRNTMIDYTKKKVAKPFSSITLGEMLPEQYTENVNKYENAPSMENLRELLENNNAKAIFNNPIKKKIIELSFGVDLGSNPTNKKADGSKIAEMLNISLGNFYMIKSRILRKLRNLANTMYPTITLQ